MGKASSASRQRNGTPTRLLSRLLIHLLELHSHHEYRVVKRIVYLWIEPDVAIALVEDKQTLLALVKESCGHDGYMIESRRLG